MADVLESLKEGGMTKNDFRKMVLLWLKTNPPA